MDVIPSRRDIASESLPIRSRRRACDDPCRARRAPGSGSGCGARAEAEAATVEHRSADRHLKLEIEKLRRAALRHALGAQGAAAGADGAAARRAGGGGDRGRTGGREGGGADADRAVLPAQAAVAQAVPRRICRASASSIAAPESCPCCGSTKLSKLGEDITETLEVIPRQWKVIQTVREKFSCRDCETITQPPAPFHVTPRGFAGPNLLAMILFEKFGQHQPLNRQSERYAREGIDLSLSTLADQVGACTTALQPLHALIERHVLAAERLHGDDTTVPILAKGKTDQRAASGPMSATTGRSAGAPRRRRSTTPRATAGTSIPSGTFAASPASCRPTPIAATTSSTTPSRPQGPITRGAVLGACAAAVLRAGRHRGQCPARQERAGDLADRARGGQAHRRPVRHRARHQWPERRTSVCACARSRARPLSPRWKPGCASSAPACRAHPRSPSRSTTCCRRWDRFARFLDDGRICLTNNAAERALRGFALGRKSWLFAGSERGADRAAVMATLIMTAKLNDVDPQAWLADVLARIAEHAGPQARRAPALELGC